MPQFDFQNVFLPQVVWLAVFFAILYGIVLLTLPRLGRVMQAREDQVTGDLAQAEAAKTAADGLGEEYSAGVAEAQDAARAAVLAARTKAAKSVEGKLARTNVKLQARAEEAEAELAEARTRALGEIEAVAADAAADIVERLTGTRPAPAEAGAAARTALG
jgi:F-type H+-transporting ATPase subunit b